MLALLMFSLFSSAVCNAGYYGSGSKSCSLCSGNMTKQEVGDAEACDTECDPKTGVPNTDRTMCGK